jgi:ATP-dependent Clp protease ATP-binding subunit ClpX
LVKQYQKLFSYEGVELNFSAEVISFIATKAMEFKLGARGLRSICEAILTDAMFELPSQKEKTTFDLDLSYAMEKLNRSKIASQHAA